MDDMKPKNQQYDFEIPFGAKDSELFGWEYAIPEGMVATIKDGKIVVRKKSDNEMIIDRIKKAVVDYWSDEPLNEILAWLEKQGEQNKWKPSKDEMDALYGLAYITNIIDDKKDEAITKLYQDLKREFFDGASYENMFPSIPINSSINTEKQGSQNLANSEKTCKDEQKSKEKTKVYDSMDDLIADALIEEIKGSELNDRDKYNRIHWIESHRQKTVWSEEDENIINKILCICDDFKRSFEISPASTKVVQKDIDKIDSWLKSFKERYTWKPSDEQMKYLTKAITTLGNEGDNKTSSILCELRTDLKKLTE